MGILEHEVSSKPAAICYCVAYDEDFVEAGGSLSHLRPPV